MSLCLDFRINYFSGPFVSVHISLRHFSRRASRQALQVKHTLRARSPLDHGRGDVPHQLYWHEGGYIKILYERVTCFEI